MSKSTWAMEKNLLCCFQRLDFLLELVRKFLDLFVVVHVLQAESVLVLHLKLLQTHLQRHHALVLKQMMKDIIEEVGADGYNKL